MKKILIVLLALNSQLSVADICQEKAHAFQDFIYGRNTEAVDNVINAGIQNDDIQAFMMNYMQSKAPTVQGQPMWMMQDFILMDKTCVKVPEYLYEYTQAEYTYFYNYTETRFSEVEDAGKIADVLVNQLEKIKRNYLSEALANPKNKTAIQNKFKMKMVETVTSIAVFERMFGNTMMAGQILSNNLSDLVNFYQSNDIKGILKGAYDSESVDKLSEMRDYLVRDQKTLLNFKSPELDEISNQFSKVSVKMAELEGIIGKL